MGTVLDKLKGRLQALRAKTIANGCTEEEALAAAAKVAELLDQHDLSISDLEIREEQCEKSAIETKRKQRQPISVCVPAIAEYCDCKVWMEKDESGIRYIFFGLRPSIEMAHYIYEVIFAAIHSGWELYVRNQRFIRHRRDEKGAFQFGMAVSIAEKLTEMKVQRDETNRRSSGRDLVVVRHAIVDSEYEKLNLKLRQGRSSGKKVDATAFHAGHAAGQSLDLHPGLHGKSGDGK